MSAREPIATAATMRRLRLIYAATAVGVIAAGLLWRLPGLGLPPVAAKYGGSVLWGAMVLFIVAALVPAARLRIVVAVAVLIAAGVEFTQLIHTDWLDAFRRSALGALLLGRTFDWWDIVAYWAGIAMACGAVVVMDMRSVRAMRRRSNST